MSAGAVMRSPAAIRPWHEVVATLGALGELGAVIDPFRPALQAVARVAGGVRVPPRTGVTEARRPVADLPAEPVPVATDIATPSAGTRTSRNHAEGFVRALRRPVNIAFVVVLLAVMTTWWVALRPVSFFGGSASFLVVKGTSMLPTLKTGDFVLAQAQPSYHVGDLVVYAVPTGQIGAGDDLIHRIVGGSATAGYILKGDNNPAPDPWTVPRSDVLGKEALVVPGAGNTLLVLRSPLFAGMVAAAIAVWLVLSPPEWMRRRPASVPPTASPEAEAVPAAASLDQAPDPPAAVSPPRRRAAPTSRAAVLTPRPAARTRSRATAPATRRARLPKS